MRNTTFHQEGFVMTQSHIRGASVLAALLLSTAAQAQVTPEQVWQNWQDLSTSYGQTIAAESEVRDGDTLTVTGMQIDSEFDGGTVSGSDRHGGLPRSRRWHASR